MNATPTTPSLIRLNALCAKLGRSRNGLKKLRDQDPSFPKPIKFGTTRQAAVYFDVSEINDWVKSKKAQRVSA